MFIYLDDDDQANASAHLRRVSVHARHHINDGLSDGDDHTKHWNNKCIDALTYKPKQH